MLFRKELIMTHLKGNYIVGLDIGTNSCGWVATDFKNNLLRLHGRTAIGSHLFEEGKSAADRRSFRTTRRRLKRRKWRLSLLEEIFDPYMSKIDPYFFARLKESGLSPLDKNKRFTAIIFDSPQQDQKFHHDYPTIYHLRNALMTEDRQFDLRLVYLAIHHIVKYRGNFLEATPVSEFNPSKIDVKEALLQLNELFASLSVDENDLVEFEVDNYEQIESIIRDETIFKLDKQREISKLLPKDSNGDTKKKRKTVAKQFANAILGYKTKFEDIFGIEVEDSKDWEFKLTDADADDKLAQLCSNLNETQQTILDVINKLFSAITLSQIVDEGKTLSQSMIRKYNDHHTDLQLLKQVIEQQDKKHAQKLRAAYDLYVYNRHAPLLKDKRILGYKKGVLSKDDFYKQYILKNLDDSKASRRIKAEIELGSFMPKQRTNQNGVIPYQLQQIELDRIIDKQGKYYPFLKEVNPIKQHRNQAPYKLDELVRFRVPYYVGPLISPIQSASGQTKQNQSFAWMVRKESGRITPWNFDQKVDRMQSANNFIKRMTTKDTYLFGEDVLPKHSLLYQKYEVLNELNNIRINKQKLSVSDKQLIYNRLFKYGKHKTISANNLTAFLKAEKQLPYVTINGLSDPAKFNSNLSTYYELRKMKVFNQELDDPKYRSDLERIIEWATIFEDRAIYVAKLKSIDWLNPEQIKALSRLSHYKGWGRLSKKLLVGLHNSNGQNIIEQLWDSQLNFMQIVNQPDFKEQITAANQSLTKNNGVEAILADAYTSPANKKAIRQVIKVVKDITRAASGQPPKQIAIEFARDAATNPERTRERGKQLKTIYDKLSNDLVSESLQQQLTNTITSKQLLHDKYYLYFMQLGRDAYSGKPINFDEIESNYEIDHILPQSFIKDDSLDNRVLVAKQLNNEKSDTVPVKLYANNRVPGTNLTVRELWSQWKEKNLITKKKFNNLLLDPDNINKYQVSGFIRRQLVETSQIIKLVATILQEEYPQTEIIVIKASYNHALRKALKLYKSRAVNDYHHAIDAYLSTICGNFLYQVYPSLRPFFVYGKFKKFKSDPDLEKEIVRKQRTFNFIWPLLKDVDKETKELDEVHLNAKASGPVIFNRRRDIFNKLERAYGFKYILVSRETTSQNQEMFKQTIYPRADRDLKSRSLIPKSKDKPIAIYGGYTGNTDAYMAIVRIQKKNSSEYKVIGVPMRALSRLAVARKNKHYDQTLHKILTPLVMFNKNGKQKRGILDFEIVVGKVLSKQVVKDGQKKFMLGSSTYLYNAKQLTLSKTAMRVLTNNFTTNDNENSLLISAYNEIVDKVNKYLPIYDINGFRKGLISGRDKFIALSVSDKKALLQELLNGLHDNAVFGNAKNIGIKTPFGMLQVSSGINLSPNSELIYQSPTGLFEKKLRLADL